MLESITAITTTSSMPLAVEAGGRLGAAGVVGGVAGGVGEGTPGAAAVGSAVGDSTAPQAVSVSDASNTAAAGARRRRNTDIRNSLNSIEGVNAPTRGREARPLPFWIGRGAGGRAAALVKTTARRQRRGQDRRSAGSASPFGTKRSATPLLQ